MQEPTKELIKMFVYQGKRCLGRILHFEKETISDKLTKINIQFMYDDFENVQNLDFLKPMKIEHEHWYTRKIEEVIEFQPYSYVIDYQNISASITFTL